MSPRSRSSALPRGGRGFIAERHPDDRDALEVVAEWRRVLEARPRSDALERELDWVAKLRLIEAYRTVMGSTSTIPSVAMLDLAYHDISPETGLHHLSSAGRMVVARRRGRRSSARWTEPPRTRAALRGRFLAAAREHGQDVTVDWVHLKVNGDVPRTVMCKDPLVWDDARVDRLIEGLARGGP
jgi:proteasome accessory factor A